MELTPEAQAVIDAVLIEHDRIGMTSARIVAAIDAYQASIKLPEPFACFATWYNPASAENPQGFSALYPTGSDVKADAVYKVIITPIRKVR